MDYIKRCRVGSIDCHDDIWKTELIKIYIDGMYRCFKLNLVNTDIATFSALMEKGRNIQNIIKDVLNQTRANERNATASPVQGMFSQRERGATNLPHTEGTVTYPPSS